jgi:hypothetical protein
LQADQPASLLVYFVYRLHIANYDDDVELCQSKTHTSVLRFASCRRVCDGLGSVWLGRNILGRDVLGWAGQGWAGLSCTLLTSQEVKIVYIQTDVQTDRQVWALACMCPPTHSLVCASYTHAYSHASRNGCLNCELCMAYGVISGATFERDRERGCTAPCPSIVEQGSWTYGQPASSSMERLRVRSGSSDGNVPCANNVHLLLLYRLPRQKQLHILASTDQPRISREAEAFRRGLMRNSSAQHLEVDPCVHPSRLLPPASPHATNGYCTRHLFQHALP